MDLTRIKIGTSGFSFPDWKGPVYPEGLDKKEYLVFYEKQLGFHTLEVNSTYYGIMAEKTARAMELKTGRKFEFIVKGFRGFTHDPFDDRITKGRPSIEQAMVNIERFKAGIKPFADAGKLGPILLQFPVFFYPKHENRDYILKCKKAMAGLEMVIEFRNSGWAKQETIDFLRDNQMGYCAVDEPKLPRLMPFVNEVTSDTGYFRLHGRNTNWFNAPASTRYDYLYSEEELRSFLPEIKKMAEKSKVLYIFFNNCHAGSAVRNAQRMRDLMGELF
ncbi:MAG: DUF72 domain-containing protein [Spirochaetia bacterium]|nr:DUF72 domain-containing protein [Spirochaetia bacterium]